MKNFLRDPVDHISVRFIVLIIINGRHDIVGVPQPIFIPRQIITEDCSMCPHGITVIGFLQFFALGIGGNMEWNMDTDNRCPVLAPSCS